MNFKRFISKSSLRSSTSSRKSISNINEIEKLQGEIESHKRNTSSLKILLENRDVAIGKLAREKEKIYVELKSTQRTNRNLQQELADEREIHSKEKDFLLNNMKRLTAKLASSDKLDAVLDEEEHISAYQNEIRSKDEVIYNICSKYFKLKKNKEELQKNFAELQRHTEEAFETIVTLLEDNKRSLDLLLDELRKSAKINPSHKKYIKLLKSNADLSFENTQLKLILIAKNEFKTNEAEETETLENIVPHCSQTKNLFDSHKILQRQKSTYSVKNVYRRSKISNSKLAKVCSKLKTINALCKYNKTNPYRSMSDSFLPRNIYN